MSGFRHQGLGFRRRALKALNPKVLQVRRIRIETADGLRILCVGSWLSKLGVPLRFRFLLRMPYSFGSQNRTLIYRATLVIFCSDASVRGFIGVQG